MKYLYWTIGILAVVGLLAYAVTQKPVEDSAQNVVPTESNVDQEVTGNKKSNASNLKAGVYRDYSSESAADTGYDNTIIFFYAPWCPECRSYEQVIEDSKLPDGLQILKADYDSSTNLKKKYGVTIQTSFVRVDSLGNKQKLWSGYGQTKSLDAILENTK